MSHIADSALFLESEGFPDDVLSSDLRNVTPYDGLKHVRSLTDTDAQDRLDRMIADNQSDMAFRPFTNPIGNEHEIEGMLRYVNDTLSILGYPKVVISERQMNAIERLNLANCLYQLVHERQKAAAKSDAILVCSTDGSLPCSSSVGFHIIR